MFSTLADDDLAQVAEVTVPRAASSPGEIVFREGDRSDTCYVVRSGRARADPQAHGRPLDHARDVRPGDFFGELAMFDAEQRSATIEAIEETVASRSSATTCAGC